MQVVVDVESASTQEINIFYKWIINESKIPWLELNMSFPYIEMLEEAKAIRHRFVPHRDKGEEHRGWLSLCIHGISSEKTNSYQQYGYNSNDETPYTWTDIIDLCPITYNFLKNVMPLSNYMRIRFMLLKAGGWISPHTDDKVNNRLAPINFALNHPKGCIFKVKKYGIVPFEAGSMFLLNVSNIHAVINTSKEDRYHMIIHTGKKDKLTWRKLIIKSYNKNYGIII